MDRDDGYLKRSGIYMGLKRLGLTREQLRATSKAGEATDAGYIIKQR